ncbi:hypothetical protein [Limibacillus halophilus]|uniref:Uncharacterized protein n=1 Tax=Limibacillus halophilus TaxID=1579333 RepID=A0A839SUI3_9PROT|nr:hypothetical protein [Limibacillus halophilus]MBB3065350.1 hypothetical protein [Limibacillus halophilus]
MGRQLDLAQNYLLLEAFDLLGRHLYGDDWTGLEAWARPQRSTREIRQEREALLAEIEKSTIALDALTRRYNAVLDHDEQRALDAEITATRQALNETRNRLRDLPSLTGSHIRDSAAYERRAVAEGLIKGALDKGELTAIYGPNQPFAWQDWKNQPWFRLDIALSLATVSPELSNLRRAPVFLPRATFQTWLDGIEPKTLERLEEMTPEMRCRAYLKEEVSKGKTKSRDDYQEEALSLIEGLSIRLFRQLWTEIVPDSWKQGGRRKK